MKSRFIIFILAATMLMTHVFAQNRPVLSASAASLALSVQGLILNGKASGQPRVITISNRGKMPAIGLTISYPQWPSGTYVDNRASTCIQGMTLATGDSCTITIAPGHTATSGLNNTLCTTGIAPEPGVITVTADNANQISTNVVILGYGCIYQGGFIYAMLETADTSQAIGGSVTSLKDQAPIYPQGIIWSSNGNGATEFDVSYVSILGIDTQSTISSPSPTQPIYPLGTPAYIPCNGNSDGLCNTNNIVSYYSYNRTEGGEAPTPLTSYAAGLCSEYEIDSLGNSPCTIGICYNDWYLPAICEMGPDTDGSGCAVDMQNITDNVSSLIGDPLIRHSITSCKFGAHCLAGDYWSSTERSFNSERVAWYESFASGGASYQFNTTKGIPLGVRCSRALRAGRH